MRYRVASHQVQDMLTTNAAVHRLATTDTRIRHYLDNPQTTQGTVGAQFGCLCGQADALPGLFLGAHSEVQYRVSAGVGLVLSQSLIFGAKSKNRVSGIQ